MNVQKIQAAPVQSFRAKEATKTEESAPSEHKINKKVVGGVTLAVGAALGAVALYKRGKTGAAEQIQRKSEEVFGAKQIQHAQDLVQTRKLEKQIQEVESHLTPSYRANKLAELQEAFGGDAFENGIVFSRDEVVAQALQAAQEAVQKAA